MKASNKLRKAFEGIGYKRVWVEWETKMGSGHFEDVTLSELQEWLYENHRVFVEIRIHRLGFYPEVYSTNGSRSIIKLAIIQLNTYFDTLSEALENGLFNAVKILKDSI